MKRVLLNLFIVLSPVLAPAGTLTISGISSGGFMAAQMATIYSDQYAGVATVAGGVFFCAENKFRKNLIAFGNAGFLHFGLDSNMMLRSMGLSFLKSSNDQWVVPLPTNPIYQSVSVCMGRPEGAHQPDMLIDGKFRPMNLDFLKVFEELKLIAPTANIAKQRVLIYQGKGDEVVRPAMADKLQEFYQRLGVSSSALKVILGEGNHNFPTSRKDAIDCKLSRVPYVASCDRDLAGEILEHTLGRKLNRAKFNILNFRRIEQKNAPGSLATYGYIYANPFCVANPTACDLHVALHGCQMNDDYDENFQKLYEQKIQVARMLVVTPVEMMARQPRMGALSFARRAGYAEYAEDPENRLMILFPQTRITTANYPSNPNGCWDWFGWTGSYYATNRGSEARWLQGFINQVRVNPRAVLTKAISAQEAGE